MAAHVPLLAVEQLVHVRIAAGAEQIVAAGAVGVAAVLHGVGGDREHRAQVRQARPQPIEGGHVRLVELARARGPEALARVGQVPDVEVRHLRALDRHDAEDLARPHRPRPSRAARDDEALDQVALAALRRQARVEVAVHVERRARLGLVDHVGLRHHHPLLSISRAPGATVDNERAAIVSYRPSRPRGPIIAPSTEEAP